jgi:hypothetical protein
VISLWLWLSLRFEEHFFPGREQISALNKQLITWMNEGLTSVPEAEASEGSPIGSKPSRQGGGINKDSEPKTVIDIKSYKPADTTASWGDELLLESIYDSSMSGFIYKPAADMRQKSLLVVAA